MPDKPRILFVDDDISLNRLSVKMLTERGYSVDTATDGLSALSKLKTHSYDVAILDNYLPKLNGIDLLKRLRDEGHPAKVIMITAVDERQLAEESRSLGAAEILAKPF